jgi:hypothetical protein
VGRGRSWVATKSIEISALVKRYAVSYSIDVNIQIFQPLGGLNAHIKC